MTDEEPENNCRKNHKMVLHESEEEEDSIVKNDHCRYLRWCHQQFRR
jgi:hypothetical protein